MWHKTIPDSLANVIAQCNVKKTHNSFLKLRDENEILFFSNVFWTIKDAGKQQVGAVLSDHREAIVYFLENRPKSEKHTNFVTMNKMAFYFFDRERIFFLLSSRW